MHSWHSTISSRSRGKQIFWAGEPAFEPNVRSHCPVVAMALFATPTASDFSLLLASGFSARLRQARNGGAFLGVRDGSLVRADRAGACVVHFQGSAGDARASVRVGDGDGQHHLCLDDGAMLERAGGLLRVHSHLSGRGEVGVSLQHARLPCFLSLAGVRPGGNAVSCGRPDAFVLEFVDPAPVKAAETGGCPAVSCAQAASLRILRLGVRFRLRSAHGRVLRRAGAGEGGGDGGEDGPRLAGGGPKRGKKAAIKKKREPYDVVLQAGSNTSIGETNTSELVFEATVHGERFLLQEVSSKRFLSISGKNEARTEKDGRPRSAAVLVPLVDKSVADAANSALLLADGARFVWGGVHLGSAPVETGAGGVKAATAGVEWLMGGMRGRLETRPHKRAWEVFRLEFVVQSLRAVMNELPPSPVFLSAEKNTRALARAQISKSVAATRKPARAPAKAGAGKGGFNHAKALAGFSEPPPKPAASSSNSKDAGTSTAASSAAKPTPIVTEASGASRAAASRKLTKREKRKKKNRAANEAAAASAAASKPGKKAGKKAGKAKSPPAGSGSSSASTPDTSNASGKENTTSETASTTSAPASGGTGPPCAACGRRIEGLYTTAQGKSFHPQCFVCAKCRRPLSGGGTFRTHNGAPHCNGCYAAHIAPRCARCLQPITETVITAMERTWHRECLTCTICRQPLSETFWIYADKPREPRCSECVGMDPRGVNSGGGNRRAVNLPGFGPRAPGPAATLGGGPPGGGTAGVGGARMHLPMMPPAGRR